MGLFFRTGKIFSGLTRSSCLSVRMTDNFSAGFGKSAWEDVVFPLYSISCCPWEDVVFHLSYFLLPLRGCCFPSVLYFLLPLRGCCFPYVLYFLILTTSCCPWEDVDALERMLLPLRGCCCPWEDVVALERKLLPLRGSCCPWEDVVFPLYSISSINKLNKSDCHDTTEVLLKFMLDRILPTGNTTLNLERVTYDICK